MKKYQLLLFLSFYSVFLLKAQVGSGYLIDGSVNGVDNGVVRMVSDNGNIILDSALIKNGRFLMKGNVASPEKRLFFIIPGNWSFQAFVENTNISLYIDTTGARHYNNGKGSLDTNIGCTPKRFRNGKGICAF